MRINHVLIDFENIQVQDLRDLNRPDFRVTIFLGSQQSKIPVDLATQMQALGDRGEYVQISGNGPNSLDFHIAFTIGEKSSSANRGCFHIISQDTGFDPLIAYLKKKKIQASRYKAISDIPILASPTPKATATRADLYGEKLKEAGKARPKTTKTLANSIRSFYNHAITDQEIEQVVHSLVSRKFITVAGGKVTYLGSTPKAESKP